MDTDERLRRDTTLEKLAKLPPVYPKGVCTAGNSSTANDGAAAVDKALKKAGITIHEVDFVEIQEAFAVQTLADARPMGITGEDFARKINVNGFGISLGHPIATTGAMRLVTLLYQMTRSDCRYGLETICGGGGKAVQGRQKNV